MYSYEYIDNYLDILKNCEPDEYKLIKSKFILMSILITILY